MNLPERRFLRFLMVGMLNTAFGYALFAVLTFTGLPYPVTIGLATLGGVAFNFQSTGRLVFKSSQPSRIGRFTLVYTLVYLLNVAAVAALLGLELNIYAANALSILPLAALTYFLQSNYVFKPS